MVQLSHPYMTTAKTMALTTQIFVGKVMSLLFNTLSRFIIVFLPRNKCLLISWLSPLIWEFPGGSDGEESACNAGDPSLIPGLGRFLGEELD